MSRREGTGPGGVQSNVAHRILCAHAFGLLLLAVAGSACTIHVHSGPNSPASPGYASAPAAPGNTVYVPVAVAPPPAPTTETPVAVARPSGVPAGLPPRANPGPPIAPITRPATPVPAERPVLASPTVPRTQTPPPISAIPRAIDKASVAVRSPTPSLARPTQPAAILSPIPRGSDEPARKPGDPRAIKKPQSPPSVK
jgi:hypothetical protein